MSIVYRHANTCRRYNPTNTSRDVMIHLTEQCVWKLQSAWRSNACCHKRQVQKQRSKDQMPRTVTHQRFNANSVCYRGESAPDCTPAPIQQTIPACKRCPTMEIRMWCGEPPRMVPVFTQHHVSGVRVVHCALLAACAECLCACMRRPSTVPKCTCMCV